MTKLIGISGAKQSGKNTSANIIAGTIIHQLGFDTKIDDKTGDLLCLDDRGIFVKLDLTSKNPTVLAWLEDNIFPFVKIYSFADELKAFCINVLGLTTEQCYGTNDEKNTKTKYKWNVFRKFLSKDTYEIVNKGNAWNKYMLAREILQVVGTDIVRAIYNEAWAEATAKKIKKEKSQCALVSDVRFPDEVEILEKNGGIVIWQTRNPFVGEDQHASECALKDYKFKYILDNANMTIAEQGVALAQLLRSAE